MNSNIYLNLVLNKLSLPFYKRLSKKSSYNTDAQWGRLS